MLKTLIFDFDGTLHETMVIYTDAFRRTRQWLAEIGYPARAFETDEIEKFLGLNLDDTWKLIQPAFTREQRSMGAAKLGSYLDAAMREKRAKLYPGTEAALDRLKADGWNMVILSNCRIGYMENARACFGLDRWFSGYYCSEAYGGIPKEKIFETLRSEQPGGFIMIGDRKGDMRVNETHGLKSVGCLYGYGSAEELANASVLAEDVSDLPNLCAVLRDAEAL